MSNKPEGGWKKEKIEHGIVEYKQIHPKRFEFRFSLEFHNDYCGKIICQNERRELLKEGPFTRLNENSSYFVKATLDVPGVHFIELMFWEKDEDVLSTLSEKELQVLKVEIDSKGVVKIKPQE